MGFDEYNILRLAKIEKMFGGQGTQNQFQNKKELTQNADSKSQNIQALPKQKSEAPFIKVEFGNEIVFTFINSSEKRGQFFSWLWKDDSIAKNNQTIQSLSNSIQSSPGQQNAAETPHKQENRTKKNSKSSQAFPKKVQEILYSQDQVGDLKKELETNYRGLLSKATDNDPTLGVPVVIKFKCKSNPSCPFSHTLQYCREENNKILYRHRVYCSEHFPQCILDDQNIQYNAIARKIDSSMKFLEEIIGQDYTIKPKEILQLFAQRIGEQDENFIYEGLNTKSVRRSIKKYFDNAVAKVKGRLRQV